MRDGNRRASRLRSCVAVALLAGACVADHSGADRAPADHGGSGPARDVVLWRRLGAWSGEGPMQTEAFIGETGALKLAWEAREGTAGDGVLRITVHSAVSGRSLARVVDHRGPGTGVAYFSEDPREFYVSIEAAGVRWSLVVEEAVQAALAEP